MIRKEIFTILLLFGGNVRIILRNFAGVRCIFVIIFGVLLGFAGWFERFRELRVGLAGLGNFLGVFF